MDDLDRAEVLEQWERDIGIRQTLAKLYPDEPQVVIVGEDGAPLIVCYDCLAPIDPERLKVMPHAIRCIGCHEVMERG